MSKRELILFYIMLLITVLGFAYTAYTDIQWSAFVSLGGLTLVVSELQYRAEKPYCDYRITLNIARSFGFIIPMICLFLAWRI